MRSVSFDELEFVAVKLAEPNRVACRIDAFDDELVVIQNENDRAEVADLRLASRAERSVDLALGDFELADADDVVFVEVVHFGERTSSACRWRRSTHRVWVSCAFPPG